MSANRTLSQLLQGEATFTDDIAPDNLHYGYTVRSTIPKGKILSITIPPLPEDYICVDYKDIPGKNELHIFGETIPFLAETTVHYIGEPILLLCGPDAFRCRELARQIIIEYKEETPHFSPANAPEENIFDTIVYSKGSFSNVKKDSFTTIEHTYTIGSQEQFSLEPHCAVSLWNENSIIIYASTLYPFSIRNNIALLLGIHKKKVKIIVPEVSSPFGGKLILPTIIAAHTSLLSYISKKPVKILYSRKEDIAYSFKRHPAEITYITITNNEGSLMGISADITLDSGAYKLSSQNILKKAFLSAFGRYQCDHFEFKAKLVKTNKVPSGYFSGSGELHSLFALELHTYKIAQTTNMDPYMWKKKNIIVNSGNYSPSYPAGPYTSSMAVLDTVVKISDFLRKFGAYQAIKKGRNPLNELHTPLRGIGLALCPHIIGDFYEKESDLYTIIVRLGKNRKLKIMTSLIDMGTSKSAYFAMIASRILNIHISEVIIEKIDTDTIPDTGPTINARAVYVIGKCIEQACELIKQKEKKKEYPIEIKKKVNLLPKKKKQAELTHFYSPTTTWESTVIEVEIDPVTFTTTCRGIWIVLDPGPVINYEIAREHVEAAAVQNFGLACMEVLEFKNGIVYQNNISEYTIPDITSVPEIEVQFIQRESHHKYNPIRGLGDQAVIGVTPAYISAIFQATDNYFTSIPCTHESIHRFMGNRT
ncbi:MAG: xanthine dehydrogenase family protein molybdopterin-binding subunit [Spirochaetales bacterium]|nr:xanthine dehydrogenase family protein molybdopterin-binding subunit [Spirochaetales bacterium]